MVLSLRVTTLNSLALNGSPMYQMKFNSLEGAGAQSSGLQLATALPSPKSFFFFRKRGYDET